MIPIQSFAKQIDPEYPKERLSLIHSSQDQTLWFKIESDAHRLVLPPMNKLRANYQLLDKAIEAISAFEYTEFEDPKYDWSEESYHVIHIVTEIGVQRVLNYLIRHPPEYIACDIETRNVSWDFNDLLAIGIAVSPTNAYTFSGDALNSEVWQEFFKQSTIKFIWHNGKFDIGRLFYLKKWKARVDEDTMLMHYVGINETRGTHGLKDLGPLYLQAPDWDEDLQNYKRKWCRQNKMKLSDFTYDMIPTEILLPYLGMDCLATYRLYEEFTKLMRLKSRWIYRKLVRAANVYSRIECNGIQIDTKYMRQLRKDLEKERDEAERILEIAVADLWNPEKYMKETGAKSCNKGIFTYKSPKQLKWIIECSLGHSIMDTSADTLEEIANSSEGQQSSFIKALVNVRKCNKYLDTYISGYEELMDDDDRIRCSYNLHGTETGRLSCSDPNLQNVPRDKRIKNLMCAADGFKLLQLDYSQAELRVLAFLSQDPWLIQVYKDDKDLHDAVALEMYGPGFSKEQRVMAKTINFGLAYGRGPGSIARTFNKTMAEANTIIDRWYRPMPMVKQWIQNRRKMADYGEACTTPFGRERHFVMDAMNRNHVQNEYINTPIQSLASDFTMLSILRIQDYIDNQNLNEFVKIVATVHDSIILEVKDNVFQAEDRFIRDVAQELKKIMESTPTRYLGENWNLPMKADVEVGEKWGSLHELDL